ncbi:hypothetical protein C8J57DRAFT_1517084 [Mycena rebaudengoi]|nr:hypothetical protein C8J57DRAFT_1517084 [Mycena rebaudengoi]
MPVKTEALYTALHEDDDSDMVEVGDHPRRPESQQRGILFCIIVVLLNLGLVAYSMHVDRELAKNIFPDIATLPTPDALVGLPPTSEHIPLES